MLSPSRRLLKSSLPILQRRKASCQHPPTLWRSCLPAPSWRENVGRTKDDNTSSNGYFLQRANQTAFRGPCPLHHQAPYSTRHSENPLGSFSAPGLGNDRHLPVVELRHGCLLLSSPLRLGRTIRSIIVPILHHGHSLLQAQGVRSDHAPFTYGHSLHARVKKAIRDTSVSSVSPVYTFET